MTVLHVSQINESRVDCKSSFSYFTLEPSTGNTALITIAISTARAAPIPFLLLFSAVFGCVLGCSVGRPCVVGGGRWVVPNLLWHWLVTVRRPVSGWHRQFSPPDWQTRQGSSSNRQRDVTWGNRIYQLEQYKPSCLAPSGSAKQLLSSRAELSYKTTHSDPAPILSLYI